MRCAHSGAGGQLLIASCKSGDAATRHKAGARQRRQEQRERGGEGSIAHYAIDVRARRNDRAVDLDVVVSDRRVIETPDRLVKSDDAVGP